jgi:hypothetical protein
MKTKLGLLLLLVCACARGDNSPPMWTGRARGMDLVTYGHKHVTIILSDGRTSVIGVPILVEKPDTCPKTSAPMNPETKPAPAAAAGAPPVRSKAGTAQSGHNPR